MFTCVTTICFYLSIYCYVSLMLMAILTNIWLGSDLRCPLHLEVNRCQKRDAQNLLPFSKLWAIMAIRSVKKRITDRRIAIIVRIFCGDLRTKVFSVLVGLFWRESGYLYRIYVTLGKALYRNDELIMYQFVCSIVYVSLCCQNNSLLMSVIVYA